MNMKRYFLGVVGAFVSLFGLAFVLHGMALQSAYKTAPQTMFRPEAEFMQRFHFLALGYLVFALAAVWIYAYGAEAKPWLGQGVRYGIALWALGAVMPGMVSFAIQPWPADVMLKATLADLLIMVITGVVIAGIYKNSAGIPRSAGARA
jgi:hypothetical protein